MTCGIYVIVNTKNKKRYIGSAVDIAARWREHLWGLRNRKHHSRHLQAAWNKYGEKAFSFDVVVTCDLEDLLAQEQFWIDAFQTTDKDRGYNISPTAGSRRGTKASEETRAKLSESHRGLKQSDESKAKKAIAMRREWERPERRVAVVTAMQSRILTEASKAKMSLSQQGENNPRAKLTDDDVRQIRRLLADGLSQPEIASRYNVGAHVVSRIKTGNRWGHVK